MEGKVSASSQLQLVSPLANYRAEQVSQVTHKSRSVHEWKGLALLGRQSHCSSSTRGCRSSKGRSRSSEEGNGKSGKLHHGRVVLIVLGSILLVSFWDPPRSFEFNTNIVRLGVIFGALLMRVSQAIENSRFGV